MFLAKAPTRSTSAGQFDFTSRTAIVSYRTVSIALRDMEGLHGAESPFLYSYISVSGSKADRDALVDNRVRPRHRQSLVEEFIHGSIKFTRKIELPILQVGSTPQTIKQ